MSSVADELIDLVEPALNARGVELVDLTYRREPQGWVLRVFIDKPGGVDLNDCEIWSDEIGRLLDERDMISTSYALEVSSPGINRPLRKPQDYARFKGERIRLKLWTPLSGRRNFAGILQGLKEEKVILEEVPGVSVEVPLGDIAQARLDKDIKI